MSYAHHRRSLHHLHLMTAMKSTAIQNMLTSARCYIFVTSCKGMSYPLYKILDCYIAEIQSFYWLSCSLSLFGCFVRRWPISDRSNHDYEARNSKENRSHKISATLSSMTPFIHTNYKYLGEGALTNAFPPKVVTENVVNVHANFAWSPTADEFTIDNFADGALNVLVFISVLVP